MPFLKTKKNPWSMIIKLESPKLVQEDQHKVVYVIDSMGPSKVVCAIAVTLLRQVTAAVCKWCSNHS